MLAAAHAADLPVWALINLIVLDVIVGLIVITGRLRP